MNKEITEKELNEQFEKACKDLGIKDLDFSKDAAGWYISAKTRYMWAGFVLCADRNGVKK
jgi:hypothetical protein